MRGEKIYDYLDGTDKSQWSLYDCDRGREESSARWRASHSPKHSDNLFWQILAYLAPLDMIIFSTILPHHQTQSDAQDVMIKVGKQLIHYGMHPICIFCLLDANLWCPTRCFKTFFSYWNLGIISSKIDLSSMSRKLMILVAGWIY